jgi:hypothetical protein
MSAIVPIATELRVVSLPAAMMREKNMCCSMSDSGSPSMRPCETTDTRGVFDGLFEAGPSIWSAMATAVLVEALLQRAGQRDLEDAQVAIDRLAAMPTDPGMVLVENILLRLRALLAEARGDHASYRDYRDRYRAVAADFGFEGHIAMAEAMA